MSHPSDKPRDVIYKGRVAADSHGDDANWGGGYQASEEFFTRSSGAHNISDLIPVLCFSKTNYVYMSC